MTAPETARESTRRRRRFLLGLCAIAVVGLGVRVGYLATEEWDDPLEGDAFFYHHEANLLAEGKGYIDPFRYEQGLRGSFDATRADGSTVTVGVDISPGVEQPTAAHPPAWPVVLAGFSAIGLDSPLAHKFVSVGFGVLGVLAIGFVGRELGGDRLGLVSAGIASVYGFLWLNDAAVMSESLVVIIVPAITFAAIRFWRRPSYPLAALLGILGAVGGLTRSELLLYVPVVMVAAIIKHRALWLRALGHAAMAAVVLVALLAPWVVRNLTTFDQPVGLGLTGTVLSQTNCDATYYGPKLGYWELQCSPPAVVDADGMVLDESQQDQVRTTAGRQYLDDHLSRLVAVAVPARLGRMFNVYDPVQTARFDIFVEGRDWTLSMVALVQYWIVLPLAVVGAFLARRRRMPLFVLLTWPALVASVAVSAFGNNRYRVAAEPTFIWLAALALLAGWDHLRRRHGAPADTHADDEEIHDRPPTRSPHTVIEPAPTAGGAP